MLITPSEIPTHSPHVETRTGPIKRISITKKYMSSPENWNLSKPMAARTIRPAEMNNGMDSQPTPASVSPGFK